MKSEPLIRFGKTFGPYLLVALILITRFHVWAFRPEFWAEDGNNFFRESIEFGAKSLTMPLVGYYFLFSRIVAYVATFFPVVYAPYFFAWGCLIVNALALGYFSREGFSWIVPSRMQRIFICCLFTVVPGSAEVFLNMCNIGTTMTLLALFLLLETPHSLSWRKTLAYAFLALSAGQTVILLPLIGYMFYTTKHWRYLLLVLIQLPISLSNFFGTQSSGFATTSNPENLLAVPRVILENFTMRLFYAPLLGSKNTVFMMSQNKFVFWLTAAAMCAAAVWMIRKYKVDGKTVRLLLLTFVVVCTSFGMILLARSYAVELVQRRSRNPLWDIRYSFLPGAVAIIIWMSALFAIIRDQRFLRGHVAIAGALIALLTSHNLRHWKGFNQRSDKNWPERAAEIQAALDKRNDGTLSEPVTISNILIHPEGWAVNVIVSPKSP